MEELRLTFAEVPKEIYLSVERAMKRARIGRRTFYNWIRSGKLQYILTPGDQRRVRHDDLFTSPVLASEELLTINETSQRFDVCRRTIYNWIRQGKLRYTRTVGGNVRIIADTFLYKPQE